MDTFGGNIFIVQREIGDLERLQWVDSSRPHRRDRAPLWWPSNLGWISNLTITDPAQRVVGSVAFTAVARIVLVAAKVKGMDGEDSRILARGKSNIGPDDGGFEYHMEQCEPLPGLQASRIAWGKAVQGSARDLLTDPNEDADDGGDGDVSGFLRGVLADGPVPAKTVFSEASGAGYSRDQIQRAARKMGVERRKTGMAGGWVWELEPQECAEDGTKVAKIARFRNVPPSPPSAPPSGDSLPEPAESASPATASNSNLAPDWGDGEWEVI